jgi:hypothetical protein
MTAQSSTSIVTLDGYTITLPAEIASKFQAYERFVVLDHSSHHGGASWAWRSPI